MKVISFHISKNSLISLFLCFWLSVPLWGVAQKEGSYWHFGNHASLHFSDTNVSSLKNSRLYSYYACATISDRYGNLLFYTNGDTVWNRFNKIMKNGINISENSPTQYSCIVSLIVPIPGDTMNYYIFTISDNNSQQYNLYYAICNPYDSNFNGKILLKNKIILNNICAKLTAIQHSNSQSIWLITHLWNSDAFYSYLIDKNGINFNPVISHVGSYHQNTGSTNARLGNLKISPNGKKIVSIKIVSASGVGSQINFEVFDFNSISGKLSNPLGIKVHKPSYCEFSPNGNYLYLQLQSPTFGIYQYNFKNIDSSSFFNSGKLIEVTNGYQMQLGLDGKIYISKDLIYFMGIVNKPNELGKACNYKDTGIYLAGKQNFRGLPFFIQSYFFKPDFEAKQTCMGDTTLFSISDTSRVDSVFWDFNDSVSGSKNYSWLWRPKHYFSDTGIYKVKMVVFHGNTSDTSEREIRISPYPKPDFAINDIEQCYYNNYFEFTNKTSVASGSCSYEWNFGDSLRSFDTNSFHKYAFEDSFNVQLIALSDYGCEASVSKKVYVFPPKANFSINDSSQCFAGNSFELINTSKNDYGTIVYKWFYGDGDTSNVQDTVFHSFTKADSFIISLTAYSNFGCADTLRRKVLVNPMPKASFFMNDSVQCLGQNSFAFNDSSSVVSGILKSNWNFGDSIFSSVLNPIHKYLKDSMFNVSLVSETEFACTDTAFKTVLVNPSPLAKILVNQDVQCLNINRFQCISNTDFGTISGKVNWYFGDGDTAFADTVFHSFSSDGIFKLVLITENTFGCKDTAEKMLTVKPAPTAIFSVNDTVQCFKGQYFSLTNLSVPNNDMIKKIKWDAWGKSFWSYHLYKFSDSTGILSPGNYPIKLIVSGWSGCIDTAEVTLKVNPSPIADFSINDPNQCFNQQQFLMNDLSTITGDSIVKNIWIIGNDTIRNQKSVIRNNLQPATCNLKLVTTSENACSDSIEKQLIVFSNPVNSYSLNDTVQCFNGNLFNFNNLSTSSDGQKVSTFWDLEEITSTLKNVNYSFKTVGTKNITLISKTDSGCYDTSAFQINVFPSPKADFSINDTDQCFNQQIFEMTDLSTIIGDSISKNIWIIGNDIIRNQKFAIRNNLEPETCNLKLVTTSVNGCSDSIEKQLAVFASPFAQFAVNDSTQCLDSNNFIFTNTSSIGSGTMTYNWTIDSLNFPTFELSNLQLKFWGKYPVKLIATSDKSCTDTTESSVYVFPNPVSAFIFLNNCQEDTMWFFDKSYSDSGSIQQWYWDFKNGKTSTLKNPFTVFYDTGQKAVTLVSTNDFGCSHDTTRFFKIETHVTAPELERATVENDEFVLIEWNPPTDGIPMTYHLEKSTDSIIWNLLSDFDNKTFNYNDLQTKVDLRNYYYRLNVTDSCQFTSPYSNIGKTILLTIDTNQQFPVLTWTPYELWTSGVAGYELKVAGCNECSPNDLDFHSAFRIPNSAFTFSDSFSKLSSPTYCYRVLATRNGDGLQSVSNVVCTPTPFRLFIPNAFTPNNDGVNDIFLPMGIYILDYNLQIFSRWGELIFESNNINQGWDGTYKGRICQLDEYFYQISANGTGSQRKTVVGTVLLMR